MASFKANWLMAASAGLVLASSPALAQQEWEFSAGLGVFSGKAEWKEIDNEVGVVPIFSAKYGKWSFGADGLVHYNWIEREDFGVGFGLNYRDDGYDSGALTGKTSKALVFEGYESPDGEATFVVDGYWQFFNLTLEQDISNKSKGLTASLGAEVPVFQIDNKFMVAASAEVTWASEDYANYVYGISGDQVDINKGRHAYELDATVNYSFGLNARYVWDENWTILTGLSYTKLDDEIADSPLVGKDNLTTVFVGGVYRF